ncbi:hypothetical protein KU6B_48070 [Mameliella alba]|uniref:hypothetical protein n=1 Tax=Mameliella alba TaxID=561184 RepID=UPI0013E503D8|nr:hypothetical protein [Mameliella alba]BBU58542.1 hypothetical protein KU6B_48070 [Mameliella alba]
MNTEQLQSDLIAIDDLLTEKRGRRPYMEANLRLGSGGKGPWSAFLYADNSMSIRMEGYGETPEGAIAALMAKVAALPDPEIAALHEFQHDLGKLIDKGRDLGIDVKWLNPITETARELAENILTHEAAE